MNCTPSTFKDYQEGWKMRSLTIRSQKRDEESGSQDYSCFCSLLLNFTSVLASSVAPALCFLFLSVARHRSDEGML